MSTIAASSLPSNGAVLRPVSLVQQLDDVEDGLGGAAELRAELELEHAAGVGGGDDVAAGGEDVVHLVVEEAARHLGLGEVVDAGRAAAAVGRVHLDELEAGDGAEELPRGLADTLGVDEVAGVLVGDAGFGPAGRGPGAPDRGGARR